MMVKQIVCIVPRGAGNTVLRLLAGEMGLSSPTISSARGFAERNDIIRELDVITTIIDADLADIVFQRLYAHLAEWGDPSWFLYQTRLDGANALDLVPPAVLAEALQDQKGVN